MEKKIAAIVDLMTSGTDKEKLISEKLLLAIIEGGEKRNQAVSFIENI